MMALLSLIPRTLSPVPEIAGLINYETARLKQIILIRCRHDSQTVTLIAAAAGQDGKNFIEEIIRTNRKIADQIRYYSGASLDTQLKTEIQICSPEIIAKAWKRVYTEALIPTINSTFASLLTPEEAHKNKVILEGVIPNTNKVKFYVVGVEGKAFVRNFMIRPDRRKQIAEIAKIKEIHLLTSLIETIDEKTLLELLKRYYPILHPGLDKKETSHLTRTIIEEFRERHAPQTGFSTQNIDESSIETLFRRILIRGYETGASDIHLSYRPSQKQLEYSYLVDGVRVKGEPIVLQYDRIFLHLTTLIQDKCKMPTISEKNKPQFGFFRMKVSEREHFTIRVVKIPRLDPQEREKESYLFVIRIHRAHENALKLHELGILEQFDPYLHYITNLSKGLVLFVGPMGSGKSNLAAGTLGRVMELHPDWPVITLERPVEFEVPGAIQVEVPYNALPSDFLRIYMQSASKVIFPSEINDRETADTAVQLAQTGHLVFSTMHCDSPFQAPLRFLGFEIEPDLYAESLELVVAQRLIRRNCPECLVTESFQNRMHTSRRFAQTWAHLEEMAEFWGLNLRDFEFKRGTGTINGVSCKVCEYGGKSRGVKGRIGVFEFWATQPFREALLTREGIETVRQELLTPRTTVDGQLKHHWTLYRNALELVRSGIVSLDSVVDSLGTLNPTIEGHPNFRRTIRKPIVDTEEFLKQWYSVTERLNTVERNVWRAQNKTHFDGSAEPASESTPDSTVVEADIIEESDPFES